MRTITLTLVVLVGCSPKTPEPPVYTDAGEGGITDSGTPDPSAVDASDDADLDAMPTDADAGDPYRGIGGFQLGSDRSSNSVLCRNQGGVWWDGYVRNEFAYCRPAAEPGWDGCETVMRHEDSSTFAKVLSIEVRTLDPGSTNLTQATRIYERLARQLPTPPVSVRGSLGDLSRCVDPAKPEVQFVATWDHDKISYVYVCNSVRQGGRSVIWVRSSSI